MKENLFSGQLAYLFRIPEKLPGHAVRETALRERPWAGELPTASSIRMPRQTPRENGGEAQADWSLPLPPCGVKS